MSENLAGKAALVTGGAKRVGAAICRRLHAQGANLMLHHRASVAEARALQHELNAHRTGSVALIQADLPMKNYVVYSVAKGGLLALTRSLARELGPEVRVNGVAPGTILWPEDDNWSDELSRQPLINQTALKRIGEPDDIAKAVEFLVTAAPYVTGQVIAVDGGRSITL